MGVDIRVHHAERLPDSPFLMISNHRSFLDTPLLMVAAAKPIHFACHHYMSQVPVMRNVVDSLGCFPLDEPATRGRRFFQQAKSFLQQQKCIGVFPEGTGPMVQLTSPDEVGPFHRGFAHLALRTATPEVQPELKIVPAAIVALEETQQDTVPFKLLSWFDPSEPLFQRAGLHPAVLYQRVAIVIGQPISIRDFGRGAYQGKRASQLATELSETCHSTIDALLKAGCY
ncbi:MAG: lysophospholipid acyltransferase family protein [Cyanobacteria bacterium J06597_16]